MGATVIRITILTIRIDIFTIRIAILTVGVAIIAINRNRQNSSTKYGEYYQRIWSN